NVITLDMARVLKAISESICHRGVTISGCAVEKSDHRQCRLLCITAHRPSKRPTHKRNELPPPHFDHLIEVSTRSEEDISSASSLQVECCIAMRRGARCWLRVTG